MAESDKLPEPEKTMLISPVQGGGFMVGRYFGAGEAVSFHETLPEALAELLTQMLEPSAPYVMVGRNQTFGLSDRTGAVRARGEREPEVVRAAAQRLLEQEWATVAPLIMTRTSHIGITQVDETEKFEAPAEQPDGEA